MDRRGFLRFMGLGIGAVVAPKVSYSFLGGILRPKKPQFYMNEKTYYQLIERIVNPPMIVSYGVDKITGFYPKPDLEALELLRNATVIRSRIT